MKLKTILIILVILAVIVGFFSLGLRTKINDLSDKFPYSGIINKTLTTKQTTFIALNYEHFVLENPYVLEMDSTNFDETCDPIYKLPIGSSLIIENTKAFTNAVSGMTQNVILGSVFLKEINKIIKFEHSWGENPTYGLYDHNDNYDIYPLAPWQESALPFKYFWDGRKEHHDWEKWNSN